MIKNVVIILVLFFFYIESSLAKILIKYKVGDQIVTNFDILDEKKYLIFFRPSLSSLKEKEILKLSENSLIREIIKKKELDLIFNNLNNYNFINDLKKNLFKFKGVSTEKEFKELTKRNNLEYDRIIQKLKYEGLWNELIFKKFGKSIKINEKKLKDELSIKLKNDKKYEYNISELLFDLEKNENIKDKLKEIFSNDFKISASKYSISNSANNGGEIGWIKETLLSEDLNKILNELKVGEVSEPIKYPNGYLLLKINDKREMKQIIDINKELIELVKFEKNKQLNQFSLLYFKKLKQNIKIDEY